MQQVVAIVGDISSGAELGASLPLSNIVHISLMLSKYCTSNTDMLSICYEKLPYLLYPTTIVV